MPKWLAPSRASLGGSCMRFTRLLGSLLLAASAAQAADTLESAKLVGPGEAAGLFGHAVAISGETILVGSPFDDDQGNDAGAAYVFGLPEPSAQTLLLAAVTATRGPCSTTPAPSTSSHHRIRLRPGALS